MPMRYLFPILNAINLLICWLMLLCLTVSDKKGCGQANQEVRIVGGKPTGINVSFGTRKKKSHFTVCLFVFLAISMDCPFRYGNLRIVKLILYFNFFNAIILSIRQCMMVTSIVELVWYQKIMF